MEIEQVLSRGLLIMANVGSGGYKMGLRKIAFSLNKVSFSGVHEKG